MSELDRRALMIGASAGAGLLLSACGKHHDLPPAESKGTCTKWGDSPLDTAPKNQTPENFRPRFICGVNIKIEQGHICARHAYIKSDNLTTEAEFIRKSSELINMIRTGNYIGHEPRVEDNFDGFFLCSKQILVIAIDDDGSRITFSDIPHAGKAEQAIIQFTEFGSSELNSSYERKQNKSFYNLRTNKLPVDNREAVFLDFWNTVKDTGEDMVKPIKDKPDTHFIYSMNIHLLLKFGKLSNSPNPTTPERFVPVILDPDVGNNGGDP